MLVRMHMGLAAIPSKMVLVLMVLIMPMRMTVFKRFVRVFMLMPLGKMQPNAQRHKRARYPKCRRSCLTQYR